jgi:hypothetical protein
MAYNGLWQALKIGENLRLFLNIVNRSLDDDDDVYLIQITTRVSQNLILYKNADKPKA